MTHRPLLWMSALGAALGAIAIVPSPVGAEDAGWDVSIEAPETSDSKVIELAGNAKVLGGALPGVVEADTATITVVPVGLPAACAPVEPSRTVDVERGRYEATVEVRCNGPHRIEVVADASFGDSGAPETHEVGVAEKPLPPPSPSGQGTASGGIHVTWDPSPHPDAFGWILHSAAGDLTFSADQLATDISVPRSTLGLRTVSWGAKGPTGPTIASEPSNFVASVDYRDDNTTNTDPTGPTDPPNMTTSPGGPGGDPSIPNGTSPPPTSGAPGTTGSTQPPDGGYTDTLPFGTRPESFIPGDGSSTEPPDEDEQAVGASRPTGAFRTTEKTAPGLVAPFALAVMMLTVAAHIAWYLRRSRPGGGPMGGGQVRPT